MLVAHAPAASLGHGGFTMARRKRRRTGRRTAQPNTVNPDAAGLDVGATAVYAAVREERATRRSAISPRSRPARLGRSECEVTTVAMESTGVYWIGVALEARGFDVVLVNARHVRSTRTQERRRLRVAALALGRTAERPFDRLTRSRRALASEMLVKSASRSVMHMQKSFDQMNVHLHHAISDLTGVSGLAITDAILDGEHDPARLADLAARSSQPPHAHQGVGG